MNLKEKLYSKVSAYNEPVSEQDIRLFEQRYNILLPQELVMFYTNICNGCKMPDGSEIKKLEEWEIDPSYIIKDFPFEDFWIWENDESYGAQSIREYISEHGANYVIPPQSNVSNPWPVDWYLYKERHLIECFFQKIKWFRRIATRYDKLDTSFLAFVHLAAIAILLT